MQTLRRFSHNPALGSKDNMKLEMEVSRTGSSPLPSPPKSLWPKLKAALEVDVTLNSHDPNQPMNMCGKKTPESQIPNSSWAPSRFEETPSLTGKPYGSNN